MSKKNESIVRRALNDESGQTLVWVVLLFALLLGMGGLVVDLGRAYISYRELQATTDAAALAAASQLPITTSNESSNTVTSSATTYSSVSGNYNAFANLNSPIAMTGAAITVTPGCVTVSGLPECSSTLLANAVQVRQTVTIPTYFIKMLSVLGIQSAQSLSLSNDEGYNTNTSTNCTGRNPNPGCPSVIPYPDTISLTTLPLTTTNLNILLSEYQVVPLSSNYRTSDSAATGANPLTTSSTVSSTAPSIVNAVGGNSYFPGGTKETGMRAEGGMNTFYAGALFTAQQYLAANARANATNVIILLGDGDANGGTFANTGSTNLNSNGTYPSNTDQCLQAITQANDAKAAGTKIYVVGYGVASGGCSKDSGAKYNGASITACSTLRAMASSDSGFFVDTSSVKCTGATSVTMNGKANTLSAIFTAIVGDLTLPRLLPNNPAETGWTASAL